MDIPKYTIRHQLKPGDLSQIAALHGKIYGEEHGFPIGFEVYVMQSVVEFFEQFDTEKDRVWIVESDERMVGFLLLMHRPNNQAQLRYFILDKTFRGIGLGKKLMGEWMDFFQERQYQSAYLFTTKGLDPAVSLYERHGFRKVSEKMTENFGFPMLEVYYRLDLS
ncbi:GNAT family N-acetyltransferase [Algoriphagus machipongonensis]|uniref:MarR family transcriptional regulator n=1 Tax=Algoriphagus machipongonensis TaxID=388413 RepID=A3HXT8_9BACT|nr:GNAT family N-acetyltransferase [Algoriphagus machipongonensis]EAZ81411.1 MarR family transcriptional regulator [Algoriphagus machipongonensis]